jgi:hypothetical protein
VPIGAPAYVHLMPELRGCGTRRPYVLATPAPAGDDRTAGSGVRAGLVRQLGERNGVTREVVLDAEVFYPRRGLNVATFTGGDLPRFSPGENHLPERPLSLAGGDSPSRTRHPASGPRAALSIC